MCLQIPVGLIMTLAVLPNKEEVFYRINSRLNRKTSHPLLGPPQNGVWWNGVDGPYGTGEHS